MAHVITSLGLGLLKLPAEWKVGDVSLPKRAGQNVGLNSGRLDHPLKELRGAARFTRRPAASLRIIPAYLG